MKNAIANLCCRKSLLLVLALLCGTSQVCAGKVGEAPRLAVSTLSAAMPQTQMYKEPVLGFGLKCLGGGTLSTFIGLIAQNPLITAVGGGLALTGGLISAVGIRRAIDNWKKEAVKINGDEIVIYESDSNHQLGHVVDALNNYPSIVRIAAADGEQHVIDVEKIRHVFDLNDNYFKMLDEQATIGSEQYPLDFLRDTSHELLDSAVIAFEHEGTNYLETFSGRLQTDNGGVELIIESSNSREIVISVDSEGKPVLNGEPLQAVIFLP